MKLCAKCRNFKELEDFTRRTSSKDGRDYRCKACNRASFKAHKEANPKKIKESNKLRQKNWRDSNPEKVRFKNKSYYETLSVEAKEKQKIQHRLWSRSNPAKVNAIRAKRHTSKLHRTPPWLTKSDWIEIKWAYEISATRSKETGIPHEVDHIIPLQSKIVSGLHVPWNLQIITKFENAHKGNRV